MPCLSDNFYPQECGSCTRKQYALDTMTANACVAMQALERIDPNWKPYTKDEVMLWKWWVEHKGIDRKRKYNAPRSEQS